MPARISDQSFAQCDWKSKVLSASCRQCWIFCTPTWLPGIIQRHTSVPLRVDKDNADFSTRTKEHTAFINIHLEVVVMYRAIFAVTHFPWKLMQLSSCWESIQLSTQFYFSVQPQLHPDLHRLHLMKFVFLSIYYIQTNMQNVYVFVLDQTICVVESSFLYKPLNGTARITFPQSTSYKCSLLTPGTQAYSVFPGHVAICPGEPSDLLGTSELNHILFGGQ